MSTCVLGHWFSRKKLQVVATLVLLLPAVVAAKGIPHINLEHEPALKNALYYLEAQGLITLPRDHSRVFWFELVDDIEQLSLSAFAQPLSSEAAYAIRLVHSALSFAQSSEGARLKVAARREPNHSDYGVNMSRTEGNDVFTVFLNATQTRKNHSDDMLDGSYVGYLSKFGYVGLHYETDDFEQANLLYTAARDTAKIDSAFRLKLATQAQFFGVHRLELNLADKSAGISLGSRLSSRVSTFVQFREQEQRQFFDKARYTNAKLQVALPGLWGQQWSAKFAYSHADKLQWDFVDMHAYEQWRIGLEHYSAGWLTGILGYEGVGRFSLDLIEHKTTHGLQRDFGRFVKLAHSESYSSGLGWSLFSTLRVQKAIPSSRLAQVGSELFFPLGDNLIKFSLSYSTKGQEYEYRGVSGAVSFERRW